MCPWVARKETGQMNTGNIKLRYGKVAAFALAGALAFGLVPSAQAAKNWTGSSNGNFSTSGNWGATTPAEGTLLRTIWRGVRLIGYISRQTSPRHQIPACVFTMFQTGDIGVSDPTMPVAYARSTIQASPTNTITTRILSASATTGLVLRCVFTASTLRRDI